MYHFLQYNNISMKNLYVYNMCLLGHKNTIFEWPLEIISLKCSTWVTKTKLCSFHNWYMSIYWTTIQSVYGQGHFLVKYQDHRAFVCWASRGMGNLYATTQYDSWLSYFLIRIVKKYSIINFYSSILRTHMNPYDTHLFDCDFPNLLHHKSPQKVQNTTFCFW